MYWTGKGEDERWLNGTKWYGAELYKFCDKTDPDNASNDSDEDFLAKKAHFIVNSFA